MFQRRRIIAAFFARPPGAGKGGGGEGGRVEFRRVLFRSTLSAAEGFLGMTARGSGSQRLHVPAAQDHRRVFCPATGSRKGGGRGRGESGVQACALPIYPERSRRVPRDDSKRERVTAITCSSGAGSSPRCCRRN